MILLHNLFISHMTLYLYRFYGVAVARRDSCPPNLGLAYPNLGPYTPGSMAYITAAWSRPLSDPLSDIDVPMTLTVGDRTTTMAARPGNNTLEYTNQPLSPETQYCVFIITQQNTSLPGVS